MPEAEWNIYAPSKSWSRETVGEIQITSALFFFGFGYIILRVAMLADMSPVAFNAVRYVISTLVMYIAKDPLSRHTHSKVDDEDDVRAGGLLSVQEMKDRKRKNDQQLWLWGALSGITAFGGNTFDLLGLVTVSAGKTAFIDNMYVVFVPFIVYFIPELSTGITLRTWLAAIISFVGLFFLSGCAEAEVCIGGALGIGELYIFLAMVCWSLNIIVVDYGAKSVNVMEMTYVNYVVGSMLTVATAVLFDFSSLKTIWSSGFYLIVLMGFMDPIGFILGSLGQMYVNPSRSALLYSFESIMAAVMSYFILGETLTWLEMLGCAIMFSAAVLSSSMIGADQEDKAGYERIAETDDKLGGGYVFVDPQHEGKKYIADL